MLTSQFRALWIHRSRWATLRVETPSSEAGPMGVIAGPPQSILLLEQSVPSLFLARSLVFLCLRCRMIESAVP